MNQKPPVILVTGTHRSGSSWVGKMLCLSEELIYHSEPFNPAFRPYGPMQYWFEYFPADIPDDHPIVTYLQKQSRFGLFRTLRNGIAALSTRSVKVFVKDTLGQLQHTFAPRKTALFKDPIALLSAPMLASKLNAQVVVVIRNPFAFIASLKVKNWTFPFNHFLEQEALMNEKLVDFRPQITAAAQEDWDIVDQGILLWNIFHTVILAYQQEHAWAFVKHETLSTTPQEAFRDLFQQLGLEYTTAIDQEIAGFSQADQGEIKRNSKENLHTWKARLSEEEISRITVGTTDLMAEFYPEGV